MHSGKTAKRSLKDPKTLRVFFSSPFGGMEDEREELTRKYFPQFQHACNAKGVQFVAVDMRWGITTEAADNAQVVNICLREIDRSDIFIGFFGQRYGWCGENDDLLQQNIDNAVGRYPFLDNVRGKSVTEFEFLHGHLNEPGKLPAAICFRDKAYDDSVREEAQAKGDKKGVFKYTAESEHTSHLMQDLINRVRATENDCLALCVNYRNPIEGAKFMFESVWQCCLDLLSQNSGSDLSPLEQTRLCHDAWSSSLTTVYLGGKSYLDQLDAAVLHSKVNLVITGQSGSGKSALLANYLSQIKSEKRKNDVVYHFVGCAEGTTDPQNVIQHILEELRHINCEKIPKEKDEQKGVDPESDVDCSDIHEIYLAVEKEMETASRAGKSILIVIDGLNNVTSSTKTAKPLYWLPRDLPQGISMLVSTQTSDSATIDLLLRESGFQNLEIQDLPEDTCRDICKEYLMRNGKELSPQQLERVVAAEQTKNPLFLKIFLSEISIYGYFRLLDKKIDSLIYCKSVKELIRKILERLEEDYNLKGAHNNMLVQQVLSMLAVSHQGLTEAEIIDMFNISSNAWSPFYFSLENFLINDSGLIRFAFPEFREAVIEMYMHTEEKRCLAKLKLIKYFKAILKDIASVTDVSNMALNRVAGELPWLQKSVGDQSGLISTLSHIGVFQVLKRRSEYELIDLWAATGLDQDVICDRLLAAYDLAVCDLYNKILEEPKHKQDIEEPPGYQLLDVLTSMADMFSTSHQHRARICILEKIIQLLEGLKGVLQMGLADKLLWNNKYLLASVYVDCAVYDKAEKLHESIMQECSKQLQTTDDPYLKQIMALTCNGMGVLYLKMKKFDEAEPLFLESIKLHEPLGNKKCACDARQNIGIIKMETDQLAQALDFFNDALKNYEEIYFGHLPLAVGNLLNNIALCHRKMGNIDEAENMYHRSLKVKAHAVGWQHEVIAACYMNLGVLELSSRQNYTKAEEYNRKAIEILELNEVKLEQREMWMPLENLILYLICQDKHEEALPIFRRVFSMLQDNNWVDQGAASVHREMMRYLISQGEIDEAANIAICHLASPKLRQKDTFILLDICDQQQPPENTPTRQAEHTVQYALEKLWPGDGELSACVVQNHSLPAGDIDTVLRIVQTMDEMNPDLGWKSYDAGATWCAGAGNHQAAVLVLRAGLKKYSESIELKLGLFDSLRHLTEFEEAYVILKEVAPHQSDNQGLMLVGGQIALHNDDSDFCRELWRKAASMSDQPLAQRAQDMLDHLEEQLKNMGTNNATDKARSEEANDKDESTSGTTVETTQIDV